MSTEPDAAANVTQAVPFFRVSDIEASLHFYVDGLGFALAHRWVVDARIRWCWLQNGGAALMLQESTGDRASDDRAGPVGIGVSVCFICKDALAIYGEAVARGLSPSRPFVGNRMWVTSLTDPDGYRIDFESPTDAPEETVYSDKE